MLIMAFIMIPSFEALSSLRTICWYIVSYHMLLTWYGRVQNNVLWYCRQSSMWLQMWWWFSTSSTADGLWPSGLAKTLITGNNSNNQTIRIDLYQCGPKSSPKWISMNCWQLTSTIVRLESDKSVADYHLLSNSEPVRCGQPPTMAWLELWEAAMEKASPDYLIPLGFAYQLSCLCWPYCQHPLMPHILYVQCNNIWSKLYWLLTMLMMPVDVDWRPSLQPPLMAHILNAV